MILKNVLLGTMLLAAVAAEARQQQNKVPVKTAEVQQQDVPVWIRGIGQVKPWQSVEISAQTNGILEEILVREGQLVKKGELLARIDDRAVKAALEQSEAQLAVVKVQLNVALRDLERYKNLRQDQAVSAQMYEQQDAAVQQLQAELQSLTASINAQQVELSYTRLLSPVDGQVGIRNIDAGNYVTTGSQSLFSIVQLAPISVEIALPQARLSELQQLMQQIRQQQPVPVQAFIQDRGALLAEGQMTVLDNRVISGTGTVRVKADFANAENKLWPGQSVVIALQSQIISQALTVPSKAIQQGPSGAFVWLNQQGKAQTVAVDVLLKERDYAVVSGLVAGQSVVIDGQSRLRAGTALDVISDSPEAAE